MESANDPLATEQRGVHWQAVASETLVRSVITFRPSAEYRPCLASLDRAMEVATGDHSFNKDAAHRKASPPIRLDPTEWLLLVR